MDPILTRTLDSVGRGSRVLIHLLSDDFDDRLPPDQEASDGPECVRTPSRLRTCEDRAANPDHTSAGNTARDAGVQLE